MHNTRVFKKLDQGAGCFLARAKTKNEINQATANGVTTVWHQTQMIIGH
jgi:hypothetical protein